MTQRILISGLLSLIVCLVVPISGRPATAAPITLVPLSASVSFTAKDYNYADGTGIATRPWEFGVEETQAVIDQNTSASANFNAIDDGDSVEWNILSATLNKGVISEWVEVLGVIRFSTDVPLKYEITGAISGTTTDGQDSSSLSAGLYEIVGFDFLTVFAEDDVNLGGPFSASVNGSPDGNNGHFIQGTATGMIAPGSYQIQMRFIFSDDDDDRQGTGTMVGESRIVLTAVPEPASCVLLIACALVAAMKRR